MRCVALSLFERLGVYWVTLLYPRLYFCFSLPHCDFTAMLSCCSVSGLVFSCAIRCLYHTFKVLGLSRSCRISKTISFPPHVCMEYGISVRDLALYTFVLLRVFFSDSCPPSSFVLPIHFELRHGICGWSGCSLFFACVSRSGLSIC